MDGCPVDAVVDVALLDKVAGDLAERAGVEAEDGYEPLPAQELERVRRGGLGVETPFEPSTMQKTSRRISEKRSKGSWS